MTTIYAVFLCYAGLSIPCTYVDDVSHFTGRTFASAAECRQEVDGFYGEARRSDPDRRGTPHYVCASRTVPTWEKVR